MNSMSFTKETLQQLVSLQTLDTTLDKIKGELERIPKQIEQLKSTLDGQKAAAAAAKTAVLNAEKKKKEKEAELTAREESARKHAAELNSVKTNDAFRALQKEIDCDKQLASDIETEILILMEEIEKAKAGQKAAEAELKSAEEKLKGEISVLEKQQATVQAKYDADKGVRDQASTPIPASAMKVYDHVRMRGKKDAVVAIDSDMCSACRVSLAPTVIVEATKCKALVTCESCQRILYKAEVLAAAARAA
jgi:predicted  nucleic acid-binding Zn-ribbon protein